VSDSASTQIGYALIISNNNFVSDDLGDRGGLDSDTDALRRCLVSLRFKVEVHNNCDALTMRNVIKEHAMRRSHDQYNCFMCFIMSYGTRAGQLIYGTDGETNPLSSFINPFNSCQSLRGKPKMFFVEATEPPTSPNSSPRETASTKKSTKIEADTLIYFASVDASTSVIERQSLRRRSVTKLLNRTRLSRQLSKRRSYSPSSMDPLSPSAEPSSLVASVCHVFGEHAASSGKVELKNLLVNVDNLIAGTHGKRMPQTDSTLGKAFFFGKSSASGNSSPNTSPSHSPEQSIIQPDISAPIASRATFRETPDASTRSSASSIATAATAAQLASQPPIQIIHLITPTPLQVTHVASAPPAPPTPHLHSQLSQSLSFSQLMQMLPVALQAPATIQETKQNAALESIQRVCFYFSLN
jgi:hypothetical protein